MTGGESERGPGTNCTGRLLSVMPLRERTWPIQSPAGRKFKIVVVEDHPLIRAGFVSLITQERDLEVCGECDGATAAIGLVRDAQPDLVLIDLTLKDGNGLDLCRHLASIGRPPAVLVISAHDEALYADRSLRAGARGYVGKAAGLATVLEAIRAVLGGRVWLSEPMAERVIRRIGGGSDPSASPIAELSSRELQVFELLGHGLAMRQIADRLHLSPKTIETYRANVRVKLHLKNSTELARHAFQWILEKTEPVPRSEALDAD